MVESSSGYIDIRASTHTTTENDQIGDNETRMMTSTANGASEMATDESDEQWEGEIGVQRMLAQVEEAMNGGPRIEEYEEVRAARPLWFAGNDMNRKPKDALRVVAVGGIMGKVVIQASLDSLFGSIQH